MKTATGLALVAIGAILAFAVTSSPHFLNFKIAGWVLIVTGIAGMVLRRPGYGWRRVVRRPRGAAENPESGDRTPGTGGKVLRWRPRRGPVTPPWSQPPAFEKVSDEPPKYERVDDTTPAEDAAAEEAAPGAAEPTVETVEEYFQE